MIQPQLPLLWILMRWHTLESAKCNGPSSNRHLSPSHRLNLKEFARKVGDDGGEEVESAPSVQGHKVKAEIAPLVGAIFDKYGDITAESNAHSIAISLFLVRLCYMYQRLEKTRLQEF